GRRTKDKGVSDETETRGNVPRHVEWQVVKHNRVDERRRRIEQECVPVGRRIDYRLCRDVRTCPRPVFDNDLLSEPLRQPLPHNPAYSVSTATGRPADDQSHWPRRIGLRPCNSRHGGQRGSTAGQMQKISAGKFHFEPPSLPLFDHLVSAREQRLGASMPSAFAVGISGARKQWRVCCQAPNTSLVPVYDRITFFGNSALRIS